MSSNTLPQTTDIVLDQKQTETLQMVATEMDASSLQSAIMDLCDHYARHSDVLDLSESGDLEHRYSGSG